MSLVPHLDYSVVGEDYDVRDVRLVEGVDAACRNSIYRTACLWQYLRGVFDNAVRQRGLLLGPERCYDIVKRYCESRGIRDMPDLFRDLLDAEEGFLCQAKMPSLMRDAWVSIYPEINTPLKMDTERHMATCEHGDRCLIKDMYDQATPREKVCIRRNVGVTHK